MHDNQKAYTALFFQVTHSILSSFLQRPSLTWTQQVELDGIVLLMASLIGELIGVTFTLHDYFVPQSGTSLSSDRQPTTLCSAIASGMFMG